MNIIYRCLLAVAVAIPAISSAKDANLDKYHEEITELSIDENINTPEVPKKHFDAARQAMQALAARLAKSDLKTDLSERNGLVLMVTVPASELFAPNDTLVMASAEPIIKAIMNPLRTPDKYKLLIAVHSDNTGTEEYLTALTQTRAEAILAEIGKHGIPTAGIVTYGMGHDEPLSSENSRKARAMNRRVEFYYVPGPIMLQELKTGRR